MTILLPLTDAEANDLLSVLESRWRQVGGTLAGEPVQRLGTKLVAAMEAVRTAETPEASGTAAAPEGKAFGNPNLGPEH